VATRPFGPALLLALAAACGGGAAAPAPDPAAGVEDAAAPAAKPPAAQPGTAVRKIDPSQIPEPGTPIMRESYAYSGASRDPFASVLETANVGPEFPDLDLVGLMYNARNPAQSVVVLRDRLNGKRYAVREGERLGRMRVASIRPNDVTFSIDDYGTERQETLSIKKPEGITP
jgi:hypothetical protein